MDPVITCYGFLVLGVVIFALVTINTAWQRWAAGQPTGDLKPIYHQAEPRTQAELLARVPSNIRRRGLSRAIYTPDFTGQLQYTHLELFPGELYEYVQRWDNGRLTHEYITQNGYSLAKGGDYV